MKTTTNYLFHLHQMDVLGAMKKIVLTVILFLLLVSVACPAQNTNDGNMLFVYTRNSNEAVMYQLDELNKITFSSKGVRIWNTDWPTEYPYSKIRVITFRDRSKNNPTGIDTPDITSNDGQIFIGYNRNSRMIMVRGLVLLDGVEIYDLQGQCVFADSSKKQVYQISLRNIQQGVYLVKARTKNTETIKKIVKQQ